MYRRLLSQQTLDISIARAVAVFKPVSAIPLELFLRKIAVMRGDNRSVPESLLYTKNSAGIVEVVGAVETNHENWVLEFWVRQDLEELVDQSRQNATYIGILNVGEDIDKFFKR